MPLQPIDQEQVRRSVGVLLAYLSDEANVTPNNMLESVVSGKSLLRSIAEGHLVVCAMKDDPDFEG